MKCTECGRGMELAVVQGLPDGGQRLVFTCWGCQNKQVHTADAPIIEPGFDGLGICPHCEDVETLGGHLCPGCTRQYEYNNS